MSAIFAHRGCPGVPAPGENTIAAFAAARRAGADGVELDVRTTADGALAVHHDRHVPGVSDVTNLSAVELPEDVPLLEDALGACSRLGAMGALGVDAVITEEWRGERGVVNNATMHVVVCVKQIPDPAAPASLKQDTHTLDRSGKLIMDDSDSYGVEMALQLAGNVEGSEVTLVSMAPGGETSGLRTALAMGAAKAILVSDDALAGSDALGTAKVLAAAIRRAEPDLVIAATESTDGYTGTLPVQVAELLGMPSVTFAKRISTDGTTVKVERQTEAGYDDVECPLPAVVTVTAGVVEPRYPSFKGIMAAKSKPIDVLSVSDLGVDAGAVGAPGARQDILDVADAESRGSGEIVADEGDGAQRIVAFLEQLKVI